MKKRAPKNQLDKLLGEYVDRYSTLVTKLKSNLLSFWSMRLPSFVDHGTDHNFRIVEILMCLLSSEAWEKMDSLEVFLLLCSVWLHDVGNLVVTVKSSAKMPFEERRKNHNRIAKDFVMQNFQVLGLDKYEAEVVGHLVLAHTKTRLDQIPEITTIGTKKVRVLFLAALLRLADELDTDYRRAPELAEEWLGIANGSVEFWMTCQCISGVEIDHQSRLIRVFAKCANETERELVTGKFMKIYQELTVCSRSLAKNKIPIVGMDLIINNERPIGIENVLSKEASRLGDQMIALSTIARSGGKTAVDAVLKAHLKKHGLKSCNIGALFETRETDGQTYKAKMTIVFDVPMKIGKRTAKGTVRYHTELGATGTYEYFVVDPALASRKSAIIGLLREFISTYIQARTEMK